MGTVDLDYLTQLGNGVHQISEMTNKVEDLKKKIKYMDVQNQKTRVYGKTLKNTSKFF